MCKRWVGFDRDHIAQEGAGGYGENERLEKGECEVLREKQSFPIFCIHSISNKWVRKIFIFFKREQEWKKTKEKYTQKTLLH